MFLTSCGFHRSARKFAGTRSLREYPGEIVRCQGDRETRRQRERETERRDLGLRLGFVNDYHVALIIARGPQFSPPPAAVRVFLAEPSPRKSPGTEGVFLSVVSGRGRRRTGEISLLRQFLKPTLANTQPNETGEAVTQVAFRCLASGSCGPVDTANRTGSPIGSPNRREECLCKRHAKCRRVNARPAPPIIYAIVNSRVNVASLRLHHRRRFVLREPRT